MYKGEGDNRPPGDICYGMPFMTKRLYANMKKNTNIRIRK